MHILNEVMKYQSDRDESSGKYIMSNPGCAQKIQGQLIQIYTHIWKDIPCEPWWKAISELRQILNRLTHQSFKKANGSNDLKEIDFMQSINR